MTTNEGKTKLLDAGFKTGLTTPAWLVGLVDGTTAPTFVVGDTLDSHAGWTEFTSYSEEERQVLSMGTIVDGAADNSTSRAVFTASAVGVVAGFFITDGTVIYGAGLFATGNRPTEIGDVLRVTVTLSIED